jgi:hypothetical protein
VEGGSGTTPARSSSSSLFPGDDPTQVLLRETDWSRTPLGPLEGWSDELRAAVSTMLPSHVPMALMWGPELVQLYNDAFRPTIGSNHPAALGRRAADNDPRAWSELGPLTTGVMAGLGATQTTDRFLLYERHGYQEETYWTLSYSPVQEAGEVGGVLLVALDATDQVLSKRRLAIVQELGGVSTAETSTPAEACRAALAVLSRAREDVPFALAHVLDDAGTTLHLAQAFGVDDRTVREWSVILGPDGEVPSWRVATSGRSEQAHHLRAQFGALVDASPIGDAVPDSAVLLPLTERRTGRPLGAIALGVSPYRALDDDYLAFFDLIAQQVSTLVTDAAYAEDRVADLERALASNRQIGAAVGILMQSRKLTQPEAFELLRRTSQNLNRKLRDVADEVVLTGALPNGS